MVFHTYYVVGEGGSGPKVWKIPHFFFLIEPFLKWWKKLNKVILLYLNPWHRWLAGAGNHWRIIITPTTNASKLIISCMRDYLFKILHPSWSQSTTKKLISTQYHFSKCLLFLRSCAKTWVDRSFGMGGSGALLANWA